jgi:Rhodopirellula transposase DDE domain
MHDAAVIERIRDKYQSLASVMDERLRRQWAAAEAMALGWGGISCVAVATSLARNTIAVGMAELADRSSHPEKPISSRLRNEGAGRKPITETDPEVERALDCLVDPMTRGHPESLLRWTCKSTRKLAEELCRQNHPVGERTVAALLQKAGYSLQANRKTREGIAHPDRNAQFLYIHKQVLGLQKQRQPVISVDTKKKELIGNFKNAGQEWQPEGKPEETQMHDFPDPKLGKAIPYGVYDVTSNEGWVSVGIDHDTAYFATASIRRWWEEMGVQRFPRASELMITADGGGSNSSRSRLWKVALQKLANELELTLRVCHFPPATSKWNKIEHRLFCYITKNWRGRPLTSYETVVNLIAATTTTKGIVVRAFLDAAEYEIGIKVSDEQLAKVKWTPAKFHGNWNYTIAPSR